LMNAHSEMASKGSLAVHQASLIRCKMNYSFQSSLPLVIGSYCV
jgi:hypothetical protein